MKANILSRPDVQKAYGERFAAYAIDIRGAQEMVDFAGRRTTEGKFAREVVPVADGHNVLTTTQKFTPDLVIMDIQLPNVSGIDLIAELKGEGDLAKVPVLAVTAYAGKGDEERIRDAGAADYLAKPVSIGPFMAAVRALLPE